MNRPWRSWWICILLSNLHQPFPCFRLVSFGYSLGGKAFLPPPCVCILLSESSCPEIGFSEDNPFTDYFLILQHQGCFLLLLAAFHVLFQGSSMDHIIVFPLHRVTVPLLDHLRQDTHVKAKEFAVLLTERGRILVPLRWFTFGNCFINSKRPLTSSDL